MKKKKRVLSMLVSLVLLCSTIVVPVSAMGTDSVSQVQPYGMLGEYLSYYETMIYHATSKVYDQNKKYTEVNIPNGKQLGLTPWKTTRTTALMATLEKHSRTHYFY